NVAVAQATSSPAGQTAVSGQTEFAQAAFVRPTTASGIKFGLALRYPDAKNYYLCYRLAGGPPPLRNAKIVNRVGDNLQAVSVPQAPIGTPFTVSCTAAGPTLSVGDGSAPKATATDTSFTSGAVGVLTDKAGLKVDNFSASAK